MKTIYACKNPSIKHYLGWFFIIGSSLNLIMVLIHNDPTNFWEYHSLIISNSLMIVFGIIQLFVFNHCKKYFVKFDTDKIIFKTRKNKLTEIPYMDIESHEIHIFEIIFHLKDGQTVTLNLDQFAYEHLRKVKQELLNYL